MEIWLCGFVASLRHIIPQPITPTTTTTEKRENIEIGLHCGIKWLYRPQKFLHCWRHLRSAWWSWDRVNIANEGPQDHWNINHYHFLRYITQFFSSTLPNSCFSARKSSTKQFENIIINDILKSRERSLRFRILCTMNCPYTYVWPGRARSCVLRLWLFRLSSIPTLTFICSFKHCFLLHFLQFQSLYCRPPPSQRYTRIILTPEYYI